MKIIFLIDNLRKGGKERRMLELIKGLTKDKSVTLELVIFKDLIEYPIIYELDIVLHVIKRKPKYSPAPIFKLYKIIAVFKPDIIHSWSTMCSLFATPSILLSSTKLLNGNIAKAPKKMGFWNKELVLAKLSFLFSDMVIGNSAAGLKAYSAPKDKSHVITNGFDFKRIQKLGNPTEVKKKYGVKSDFIVAMVAAFANRKDYDTYISAAQLVLSERDDVTFLAVGHGPNLELTKRRALSISTDRIIFTGSIQDIESLVNSVNIGVLCTNNSVHGEGISNSILEYMALSKPVVATEGGGTNEIIVHNNTGFLIPAKSPKVLADKISLLLNDPEKAKLMGQQGRQRIEQHFNLEDMTKKYLSLYNQLLV